MCNAPLHQFCFSRRAMLVGSAAMVMTPWLHSVALTEAAAPQNAISPDAALKRLMDGNARYAANRPSMRDFSAGRAARAKAQYPIVAVLSCADSRVAPEFAFDQGPGDVFVVRVAGNFANDDGLASIEYGVHVLKAPLVMVLGHTNCGAVDAAIKVLKDNAQLPGHLPGLVASIKPAVEAAKAKGEANLLDNAIIENVRLNAKQLETTQPVLAAAARDGKIKVVGAVYDLASGKIKLI